MKKPTTFQIGDRKIGTEFKPLIIFELGINHNGNLKLAKKIVDSAILAGAEVIKHQTHLPEDEMSNEAKKIIPVHANDSIYNIIKKCSLNERDELELKNYIEKKKCNFSKHSFFEKSNRQVSKI